MDKDVALIESVARAIRAQAEYPVAASHTEEQFQKEHYYWLDIARVAIDTYREGSLVCRTQREECGESQVTVETVGSTPPLSTTRAAMPKAQVSDDDIEKLARIQIMKRIPYFYDMSNSDQQDEMDYAIGIIKAALTEGM